jgi:hypothetical protein
LCQNGNHINWTSPESELGEQSDLQSSQERRSLFFPESSNSIPKYNASVSKKMFRTAKQSAPEFRIINGKPRKTSAVNQEEGKP